MCNYPTTVVRAAVWENLPSGYASGYTDFLTDFFCCKNFFTIHMIVYVDVSFFTHECVNSFNFRWKLNFSRSLVLIPLECCFLTLFLLQKYVVWCFFFHFYHSIWHHNEWPGNTVDYKIWLYNQLHFSQIFL